MTDNEVCFVLDLDQYSQTSIIYSASSLNQVHMWTFRSTLTHQCLTSSLCLAEMRRITRNG